MVIGSPDGSQSRLRGGGSLLFHMTRLCRQLPSFRR